MKDFSQGFEPKDYKHWQNKIAEDLQKIKLETTLMRHDLEGVQIQPLYSSDSVSEDLVNASLPGHYPYQRSDQPYPKEVSLVHRVQGDDYQEINKRVENAMTGGADCLLLNLDHSKEAHIDLLHGSELLQIFDGIDLTKSSIAIDMGEQFLIKTLFIKNILEKNKLLDRKLDINFKIDPISFWAKNGKINFDIDFYLSNLCELIQWKDKFFNGSKLLEINSSIYHNAGASEAQEIAFSCSILVEYLKAFHSYGLNLDDVVSAIAFKLSYDEEFFTGIAKTRALRWCISRVYDELKIKKKNASIHINAQTSRRMLTQYDAWGNILRSTLASFSALNSAIDTLEVFNFDLILNEKFSRVESSESANNFADKISRNTFHILKEESFALSVIDPAGGSFYVEERTNKLAEKSWEIFQNIEKGGGFIECLRKDIIQSMLTVASEKRENQARYGQKSITGVSDYPNLDEKLSSAWSEKTDHQEYREYKKQGKDLKKLVKSIRDYKNFDKSNKLVEEMDSFLKDLDEISLASHSLLGHQEVDAINPIRRFREAEQFESLRFKVESLKIDRMNKIICFGNESKLAARISFITNFFQVIGIDSTIDFYNEDIDWSKFNNELVTFVALDSDYEDFFEAVDFTKLSSSLPFLAGKYKSDQVKGNIFKGQDKTRTLQQAYKFLGGDE